MNIPHPHIESGTPLRSGYGLGGMLRSTLRRMKPGQSFAWHEHTLVYRVAAEMGVKVATRKVDGGYRVWRTG